MPNHNDLKKFDWSPDSLKKPLPSSKPFIKLADKYHNIDKESHEERIMRMIVPLRNVVSQCSLCSLGRKLCTEKGFSFDAHVFSNMCPSKFMVVGQNPGFNECMEGMPFVGDAGKFFDVNLQKNGLSRSDFYITNILKCHTVNNEKPTDDYLEACCPIFQLEIKIIKPVLLITLGSISFSAICPDLKMSDHLGSIVNSGKFGVKVYPVYHPSPRNMSIVDRREKFEKHIGILCKLVKKLCV
jgi:DNA polymerase